MKSVFERKFHRYLLIKKKNDELHSIDAQERSFKAFTNNETKILNARVFYAASKINALVRGFLDRVLCRKLKKNRRALSLIQRIMKGKIGRLRWRREYWRSISVVKSDEALKEIIARSTLSREKSVKQKKQSSHWKEYYDPLTECFWYYDAATRLNTWEIPVCFQTNLICHWDGYESFGGVSSASLIQSLNESGSIVPKSSSSATSSYAPCRCLFKSVEEYRNHLRLAHRWYCVACLQANPGLCFPKCSLCQNQYNEDGIDGEKILKQKMKSVEQELSTFIQKDLKQLGNQPVLYHVRDRLVDIGAQRKQMLQTLLLAEASSSDPRNSTSKGSKLSKVNSQKQLESLKRSYSKSMQTTFQETHEKKTEVTNTLSNQAINAHAMKLPPLDISANITSARPKSKPLNIEALLVQSRKTTTLMKSLIPAQKTQFDLINQENDKKPSLSLTSSSSLVSLPLPPPTLSSSSIAQVTKEQKLQTAYEEEQRNIDPLLKGMMDEHQFQILTSIHDESLYAKWKLELVGDDDGGDEEEDDEDDDGHSTALGDFPSPSFKDDSPTTNTSTSRKTLSQNASQKQIQHGDDKMLTLPPTKEGYEKVIVCVLFLEGKCSLTTCPFAHPGIRDTAKLCYHSKRLPTGQRHRTPYVVACPWQEPTSPTCEDGKACTYYHHYVRPPTSDIILSLYPMKSGHTRKEFPNGAVYFGSVCDDQFHGYGTMTWAEQGAIYMGEWKNNLRHGTGLFRTKDGMEYIGQFVEGKREGWGVLHNANGEEFIGQWKNGKIEGIGMLVSPTGESFRGCFQNNQYHGVGFFSRANGDMYMGYCQEGRAHGLGILSLSTGEKYKGHFERNARHGKGACAYPNGARYAGQWYRGVHDGFGMFLMDQVKYIGHWKGGKKHGYGRYYFPNGEFYDGEFVKNKAKGVGVYYFLSGNIFSGEWDNDKRNGRGTYLFSNGSKYTGHFVDNNIHGKGKFDFANGAFYRGQFDWNTKHGKGIYTWPNGNEYRGDFFHEKLSGKGEMKYMMGHRYVGDWENNEKHGFGIMYYANGSIYEGEFRHDIRSGKGKLTLIPNSPVEESYEGDWVDDQWHGKGKYCYRKTEGTVYDGDWVYGVRQGYGTLSYQNGSYYRGEFRQNQMWGKGVYVGADNTQYDGDWRANMRQGFGTSLEPDGSIYHGEYFGNMKQGKGKLIRPDGSIFEGQWEANIIIGDGKVTIPVGDPTKRDGLPKKVTLRVFSY